MFYGGIKLNEQDFRELYDNYTQIMLFANSNKHKLENIHEEVVEIQKGCHEVIETSKNQEASLNSLNGLKSRLDTLQDEIDAVLYKYSKIGEMLRQIDVIISDYYEMNIEIALYELNGIENDLFGIKDEYKKFRGLKLEMDAINEKINNKISELSH